MPFTYRDDGSGYSAYTTYARKLHYREPDADELRWLKRKNRISCGMMGGIVLLVSLGVIYLMQLKDAPVYAYIVPAVGILYALGQFAMTIYSRYGVFDGVIVRIFVSSNQNHVISVWSEQQQQYCPIVHWIGADWRTLEPGQRVRIFRTNRSYFSCRMD